jgi:hypothetical protein
MATVAHIEQFSWQGLDLVEPLYLGGLPSYYEVSADLGFTRGFVGCISRLGLGRTDITRTRERRVGVTGCETCAQNPCTNGGLCQESSSPTGYVCLCPQVGTERENRVFNHSKPTVSSLVTRARNLSYKNKQRRHLPFPPISIMLYCLHYPPFFHMFPARIRCGELSLNFIG